MPDILDGVVVVDVGSPSAVDVEVHQSVADDLVEHVIEEGHAGIEPAPAATIESMRTEIFVSGVACDCCLPHGSYRPKWVVSGP